MSRRNFLKFVAGAIFLPNVSASAQSNTDTFNVFFDFGQSELPEGGRKLLDRLVEVIAPAARVTISGNCDSAEPEPEKLGLARANAVLTHLLRHRSMSKVRFNAVSEGAPKPLVQTPPNTREARNRRVVIAVTR